MTLVYILSATIIVSLMSLVGVLTFAMRKNLFERILILVVGFAAGGLIGSAFLHLLPEAIKGFGTGRAFPAALIGFCAFFSLERYFHWRHCHDEKCDIHAFTYLNLIGDGVHNFADGMIIAASFVTDFNLGVVTTLAVIFHELPQEIGDFAVLIYGGFTKAKALFFNFLSATVAVLGALIGYFLAARTQNISLFLISFTAGGFIYIAASDLIPELHKQKDNMRANTAFGAFILGLLFMLAAKLLL